MKDNANPNRCLYCGVDKQAHVQRYAEGVGGHGWTELSGALRKKRMLERRSA